MALESTNPLNDPFTLLLKQFDPYPKLAHSGTDFHYWRTAWTRAFSLTGLTDAITGANPITEQQRQQALHLLFRSVDSDLQKLVLSDEDPYVIWHGLAQHFDQDTDLDTLKLLSSLTKLRKAPSQALSKHLDNFHTAWVRLAKHCNGSGRAAAEALKPLTSSEAVKCYLFLSTLPDSYNDTIEALLSGNVTWHDDIQTQILQLSKISANNETAPVLRRIEYDSNECDPWQDVDETSLEMRITRAADKECSYCRKHGGSYIGHDDRECRTIKRRSRKARARRRGLVPA